MATTRHEKLEQLLMDDIFKVLDISKENEVTQNNNPSESCIVATLCSN